MQVRYLQSLQFTYAHGGLYFFSLAQNPTNIVMICGACGDVASFPASIAFQYSMTS